jgi:Ca-activated chloride channel family protein
MALEQAAVNAIAASLQAGDVVSMVTWNDTNTVVLDSLLVTGPSDPTLLAANAALVAGGSTNLYSGLTVGYGLAQKNYAAGQLNRVILISDGQANTGVTEAKVIGDAAALNDGDGIYLVGVGVGDGVNDTLMDAVTDAGRGAYVYLDQAGEAQRMFVDRFDETMDVAARAVQVQLKLPWYFGLRKFYGEAVSSNPRAIEPQHLAPDDAMVFVQDLVACSPDQVVASDAVEVITRWQVPITHVAQQASYQATVGELLERAQVWQPKGRAIVAYAEALKQPSRASLLKARELGQVADPAGTDPELSEIRQLIELLLVRYPA